MCRSTMLHILPGNGKKSSFEFDAERHTPLRTGAARSRFLYLFDLTVRPSMDDIDQFDEAEDDIRRAKRKELKDQLDVISAQKSELRTVGSECLTEHLKLFGEVIDGVERPRELYLGSVAVSSFSAATLGQWNSLGDKSTRFNWQDLANTVKTKFANGGAAGVNWEKLGGESRMLFNCVASFNTMVGPIHKEEKLRKLAVRRQREDIAAVKVATGEVIENHEEDGNDEATNARVTRLYQHLDSYQGPFDLLKVLVDPVNPVQSVENFFDFAYLHKVSYEKLLLVGYSSCAALFRVNGMACNAFTNARDRHLLYLLRPRISFV
jgi:hypothetical protein